MSKKLSRRSVLKIGSTGAAFALTLPTFTSVTAGKDLISAAAGVPPSYDGWLDVYRDRMWNYDKIVRSTHFINCWYQSHCAWDVYVKDGLVVREEQAADYPQTNKDVPDFNPRGCQKGCCFSERMYEPVRIKHPMRRVGPRGGGKWERVSWDEALDDIADKYIDVMVEDGTNCAIWDIGAQGLSLGVSHAAQGRFTALTRSISLDPNTNSGDGHHGAYETFGQFTMDRSADDYFNSDLILIWGSNPIYTSIPNAHFFIEAKYNGTQIVCISPDYSPSAIKSDMWVPVRAGTDAALALGVAHLLIKEGHIDEAFVSEQTDFPFLVRSDTGKFLRRSDIEGGNEVDRFYYIGDTSGALVKARIRTLKQKNQKNDKPRLDVRQMVRLHDGQKVEVRSVFSLIKERLETYTPEAASKMCGVSPEMIRSFAQMMAKAKAMSNVSGSSICKYYHGNLAERAIILNFCLLGHMGRKGAGYSAFSLLNNDGWEHFVYGTRLKERAGILSEVGGMLASKFVAGGTEDQVFHDVASLLFTGPGKGLPTMTPGSLFWQVHGGVMDINDEAENWMPHMKRPLKEDIKEALDKKWMPLQPPADKTPRLMFHFFSNALRRVRQSDHALKTLWPKLKLDVVIDWRMTSTSKHADYVLPASTWYERYDHKWVTPLVPFHHVSEPATEPLGESWSDWKIIVRLAEHIQKRAKARGIKSFVGHDGVKVQLDRLYDDMTMGGEYKENDDEKVSRKIMEMSSNLNHLDWEETKKRGYGKFSDVGKSPTSIGNMGEMKDNETFVPLTYHVRDKKPYPTTTRRIQFYIDNEVHLRHDEALPRFKEPPALGGDYPLTMTSGHTRWSIHSTWRDNKTLLRLQRGGPCVYMNPDDMKTRNIKDGDWVKVWNDVGHYYVRIKRYPSIAPGLTLIYHAWENYQFPGKGDPRQVYPSPVNPVDLEGGESIHFRVGYLEAQPGGFDRETRIDIRLMTPKENAQRVAGTLS